MVTCEDRGGSCTSMSDCPDARTDFFIWKDGLCYSSTDQLVCCIPNDVVCFKKKGRCHAITEVDSCFESGRFFSWFPCNSTHRCCLKKPIHYDTFALNHDHGSHHGSSYGSPHGSFHGSPHSSSHSSPHPSRHSSSHSSPHFSVFASSHTSPDDKGYLFFPDDLDVYDDDSSHVISPGYHHEPDHQASDYGLPHGSSHGPAHGSAPGSVHGSNHGSPHSSIHSDVFGSSAVGHHEHSGYGDAFGAYLTKKHIPKFLKTHFG